MILFFPQWQGAGQHGQRLDVPARKLIDALRPMLGGIAISEVPLFVSDTLTLDKGIWGRWPIFKQLIDARHFVTGAETVFTIGGDCGIEVAPIPYLHGLYPDFGVVWIDAHADLNTPESSPSGTFHGMPLRVLMGEGDPDFTAHVPTPLTPAEVVMVGVRALDPAERDFIDQQGIVNFPVETPDLTQKLIAHLSRLAIRNVYIHLDLDALDPDIWPYTDYPAPGGFSFAGLANVVRSLSDAFSVVGMSLAEYTSADGQGLDTLAPVLELFAQLSTR